MSWEQICILCQTELKQLETTLPPLTDFFHPHENIIETLVRYEQETESAVSFAIREFAETNKWPPLNPIQKMMLSFRLDFGASIACLLAQQPPPWIDEETPNQRQHRLGWLMLFAWENEGFPQLQKRLQQFALKWQ